MWKGIDGSPWARLKRRRGRHMQGRTVEKKIIAQNTDASLNTKTIQAAEDEISPPSVSKNITY